MRLANALCRFAELATEGPRTREPSPAVPAEPLTLGLA
jgi:hypothetical protein